MSEPKACYGPLFAYTELCLDSTDMVSGFQELPSVEKSLVCTTVCLFMFL